MEPIVNKSLLFFVLFVLSSVNTVPIQPQLTSLLDINNVNQWQPIEGAQCASRCARDQHVLRFDPQTTYVYRLKTETELLPNGNGYSGPETAMSLEALVEIHSQSECDFTLQLTQTRVSGVTSGSSTWMEAELERNPLRFGFTSGHVTDVCVSPDESTWSENVKKAIVSSLQMTSGSLSGPEVSVREKDFQGICDTRYEPISDRFGKYVIKRTKLFNKCESRELWTTSLYPRYFESRLKSISLVNGSQECFQTISGDLIQSVTCQEKQNFRFLSNLPEVKSEMSLKFEKSFKGFSGNLQKVVNIRTKFSRNHLKMSSNENNDDNGSVGSAEDVLRQLCRQQEPKKSPELFQQLIRSLKSREDQTGSDLYQRIDAICGDNAQPMRDLLLDACAVSGSEKCAKIITKWLEKSGNGNSIKAQFLFRSLSFVNEPEVKALEQFSQLLEQNSDKQHVVLGITAYLHNLKHVFGGDKHVFAKSEERITRALMSRVKQSLNEPEVAVVAIKGLSNVGLEDNGSVREELTRIVTSGSSDDSILIAILKLLSEKMDSKEREMILRKVLMNERIGTEVRIQSLKTILLSGSSETEVKEVLRLEKESKNKQFLQFLRSFVWNLKQSSDPHKRNVLNRQLSSLLDQIRRPEQWSPGMSRNIEKSYLFDAIGTGIVFESDLIYEQNGQKVPKSLVLNISVPVLGKEINFIELELRQKGFEKVFENKIKEIQRNANNYQKIIQILTSGDQWQQDFRSEKAFVHVVVKLDGKTLLVYHSNSNNNNNIDLRQALEHVLREGGALATQPINTRVTLPSSNGLPIVARVNSTLVAQMRSRAQHVTGIKPSFAWKTEVGLELGNRKRVGVAFNVQSEPQLEAEVKKNGNEFEIKVLAPKEKTLLIGAEVEVTGSQGSSYGSNNRKYCSNTEKVFGISLCFERNDRKLELYVRKPDPNLQSYVVKASREQKSAHVFNYHVLFETPNSQIERNFEFLLNGNGSEDRKEVKAVIRSPFYKAEVNAKLTGSDVQLEVESGNGRKELSLDLGLEQQTRGQKREMRPRVRVTWRGTEVMNVLGSISVSKGRKNQLMINLEGNQKQFLKGSLVREGERKSSDIRMSTDFSIQLMNGLEIKINGLLDKSPKHVTNDFLIEYRLNSHQKKHSVKTSLKLQNLSQNSGNSAQNSKLSAFGEMTSTQFPQLNAHVAYNLLQKPEHVENEMTFQWGNRMADKVHVLQLTKWQPRGEHVENTWNVEITPLNVNYELRLNSDLIQKDLMKAEVMGKDRTGSNTQNDFRAQVEYKHVTHAPLYLTLNANLKTNSIEIQYSDEMKEMSGTSGLYKGKTEVTWQQPRQDRKSARMDYEYRKLSNEKEFHHQLDLQMSSPSLLKNVHKYSSKLRMSRSEAEVYSKLISGPEVSHELSALLSQKNRNHVNWNGNGLEVSAHVHPHVLPIVGELQVVTRGPHVIEHKTEVELIPETRLQLKSETKSNQKNLFRFESDINRRNPSKIQINCNKFDGSLDFQTGSGEHVAKLEVTPSTRVWSHSSYLTSNPMKKSFQIKSNTISAGNPLFSFETEVNRHPNRKSILSIEYPAKRTSVSLESQGFIGTGSGNQKSAKISVNCGKNFRHLSEYSEPEAEVKVFSSKQSDFRSGLPLYSLDYSNKNGFHSIGSQINENYLISGELKTGNDFKSQLSLKNREQNHENSLKLEKQEQKYVFSGNSRRNGENFGEISGKLSTDLNQMSELRFHSPRVQTRALIQVTPMTSSKWSYDSPRAQHVTQLDWNEHVYGLDSKTSLTGNQIYSLAGRLSPNRKTSFVSIKTPGYDISGHVDRDLITPSVKLNYISPRVQHVTEVSANRDRKSIRVESKTDRKSPQTGNEYQFEGNYYHLNPEMESNFGLKVNKNWKIDGKVLPFGTGSRYLTVNGEFPEVSHQTEVKRTGNQWTLRSRSNDKTGNNLLKIDSFIDPNLTSGQKSHISVVSAGSEGNWELEPNRKSMKVEFRNGKWDHKTVIGTGSQYSLESKTKSLNKNVFDLNSSLEPMTGSGRMSLKTPLIDHQMALQRNIEDNSDVLFDSNTEFENNLISKIGFNSKKHLNFESKNFKANTNWNRDGVSVAYSQPTRGRHVLGSVMRKDDGNTVVIDFRWDQHVDSDQHVTLEWTRAQSTRDRSVHVARVDYAGNELRMTSDVKRSDTWLGPNTWSVEYRPRFRAETDSMSVKVNHVLNKAEKEMECRLELNEGSNERKMFVIRTKLEPEVRDGNTFGLNLNFESNSRQNPEMNVKLNLKSKISDFKTKNTKFMTELKAERQTKLYSANWRVSRVDHVLNSHVEIETPSLGRKELEFESKLLEKNGIEVNLRANNEPMINFRAKAETGSQEKHISVDLESKIAEIPSISVSGDYLPEKEISFKIDSNGKRKAEMSLTKTGSDIRTGIEVNFNFESDFWPKIESKYGLKSNSKDFSLEFRTKLNQKDVIYVQMNGKKSPEMWTGSASVSQNGSELIAMQLNDNGNGNGFQFSSKNRKNFLFNGKRIHFSFQKLNSLEKKLKMNFCEESEEKCIDLSGSMRTRDEHVFPEIIELSFARKGSKYELKSVLNELIDDNSSGSSLLGLTSGQRVQRKSRNSLQVSINSNQFLLESIQTNRKSSKDLLIRAQFPTGSEFQLKSDLRYTSGSLRHKAEVKESSKQETLFESDFDFQNQEKEIQMNLEINSKKSQKKSIQFYFRKPSQDLKIDFRSKLVLNLSQKPENALEIESKIERKPEMNAKTGWNSSPLNTTWSLHVSTRDQKAIDFNVAAHASTKSFGILLKNLNRKGIQKNFQFYFRSEPEVKRSSNDLKNFSAFLSTNLNFWTINGKFNEKELNYRIIDRKLRQESEIRIAFNKNNCFEAEVKTLGTGSQQTLDRKYEMCLNFERKDQKSAEILFRETGSELKAVNEIQISANLREIDPKFAKFELNWNPMALKEMIEKSSKSYPKLFENQDLEQIFEEFIEELKQKSEIIAQRIQISDIFSVFERIFEPISGISREFYRNVENNRNIQQILENLSEIWANIAEKTGNLGSIGSEMKERIVQNLWRPLVRGIRRNCKRSEFCYKIQFSSEKYGINGINDVLSEVTTKLMRESHKLIVRTSGHVANTWSSNTWTDSQWFRDYRQSIVNYLESIIESNDDLNRIYLTLKTVMKEISKEFDVIDGKELKKSSQELMKMIIDVQRPRIIEFDPKRGRILVQIGDISRNNGVNGQRRSALKKRSIESKN